MGAGISIQGSGYRLRCFFALLPSSSFSFGCCGRSGPVFLLLSLLLCRSLGDRGLGWRYCVGQHTVSTCKRTYHPIFLFLTRDTVDTSLHIGIN